MKDFKQGRKWESPGALLLGFCVLSLLAVVVVPYLRDNNVLNWDAIGHLFAGFYLRENFFPDYQGWNPMFFGGFSQGMFYPPLFHYLTAFISFALPIEIAFKLIVSLSILALPLAAFYFARGEQLAPSAAVVAATGIVTLLACPLEYSAVNNAIGGTLYSTLNVGLAPNAMAMPLFLLYAGGLRRQLERQSTVLSSFLLSALVLTHTISALAAGLYSICVIARSLEVRNSVKWLIGHYVLTLGLCAFWVVPFVAFIDQTDTVQIGFSLAPAGFILVVLGVAALVLQASHSERGLSPAGLFFLLVICLTLAANFVPVGLHLYRFFCFALVTIPVFVAGRIPGRYHYLSAGILALVMFVELTLPIGQSRPIDVAGPPTVNPRYMGEAPEPRTWVLSGWGEQVSPHINQTLIPMHTGVPAVKGLFVESTRNARFLMAGENLLARDSLTWGVAAPDVSRLTETERQTATEKLLFSFAVGSILSAREVQVLQPAAREPYYEYLAPVKYLKGALNDGTPLTVQLVENAWSDGYFYYSDGNLHQVQEFAQGYVISSFAVPASLPREFLISSEYSDYLVSRVDQSIFAITFSTSSRLALEELAGNFSRAWNFLSRRVGRSASMKRRGWHAFGRYSQLSLAWRRRVEAKLANIPVVEAKLRGRSFVMRSGAEIVSRMEPRVLYRQTVPLESYRRRYFIRVSRASGNWDRAVNEWFFGPRVDLVTNAPADALKQPSDLYVVPSVDLPTGSKRTIFEVDSKEPVPVFIRASYSPKWKVFNNGKRLPVFKAAPHFMLVVANGQVEMTYGRTGLEMFALIISGTVILGVFGRLVVRQFARRNSTPSPLD